MSERHLRLHAIGYASDSRFAPVAPLVFAEDLSLNGTKLERASDDADLSIPTTTRALSRKDGAVLLHHDDKLYVSPTEWIQFQGEKSTKIRITSAWARLAQEATQFEEYYSLSRRLVGIGGTSKVHLGYSKIDGSQVACKIIRLDDSRPGKPQRLATKSDAFKRLQYHVPEVDFLDELRHVRVAQLCQAL